MSGLRTETSAGSAECRARAGRGLRVAAALIAAVVLASHPSAAQTDPPPIGAVVREIPRDLWHFISWDTALVLGVGGGAALVGHIWDDDLVHEIDANPSLNNAMSPGNTYGAFSTQVVIGVGLYTGGWLSKHGGLAVTGADIMRAQLLSQIYVQAIKFSVQRERPDKSDSYSFPSGHSASAFATAGVLQRHYGWKVGVPATLVAAYVATARVHDNRHYLSDVIFGASMGIAAGRTVTLRAGRYNITAAPTAVRRGAGLMVTIRPPAAALGTNR
jgi:membrane-associated phospholipid phosphatase